MNFAANILMLTIIGTAETAAQSRTKTAKRTRQAKTAEEETIHNETNNEDDEQEGEINFLGGKVIKI
jgi:hypothetical protein